MIHASEDVGSAVTAMTEATGAEEAAGVVVVGAEAEAEASVSAESSGQGTE